MADKPPTASNALFNSLHGNEPHCPQCSRLLFLQQRYHSHLPYIEVPPIVRQPLHSLFKKEPHSAQSRPHKPKFILVPLHISFLNKARFISVRVCDGKFTVSVWHGVNGLDNGDFILNYTSILYCKNLQDLAFRRRATPENLC